jgi:hypothetical protein
MRAPSRPATARTARNGGTSLNELLAVSAASPTSIWAVGVDNSAASPGPQPLILHYDGRHWAKQDPPVSSDPLKEPYELLGVSAVSRTEAWAVGRRIGVAGGNDGALILHFTGGKWHLALDLTGATAALNAVTATSATNAWAAGEINNSGRIQSLIMHWDGRAWTRETSPNVFDQNNLFGIDASSPGNVIAVGSTTSATGPSLVTVPLSMRWNGHTWTRLVMPNIGGSLDASFFGVAVTSPRSARIVGLTTSEDDGDRPLVEQLNGTRLSPVKTPVASAVLGGIAGSSASNQWAVGSVRVGSVIKPYALHFG